MSAQTALPPPIELAHELQFPLGALTVVPALREVAAPDGTRQTLEPRVMQVLVALARAGGGIVTRDELIRTCWNGTVVGEDAIHRAVSQLRRVSEGVGREAFRIETIAKVGYRLVLAEPAVVAEPVAARRVPSRWMLGAAVAVVACGVALFAVWRAAPEGPAYSVSVQPFTGAATPAGFDNELLSHLSRRNVPTAGGQVRLTLAGAIEQRGGDTRLHTRLVYPGSEEVLWSGDTSLASTEPTAVAGAAAHVSAVARCTLAFANDADRAPSRSVLSRFAQACQLMIDGEAEQGVQVARQITRESTEFAGGWFALAHHANSLYLRGRTEDVALREQALVAAEKLIALRPKAQEGYVYKALAMPPEQAVERERLLRDAVSRQAIYSDVGRAYLGDFLVQVGRLQEAFHLYRDHAQQNADVAMQHVRVFFAAAATERWPIAQEALEQVGTLGSSSMPLLLWRQAVWNGDWAEAERQIPFEHPAQVQAGIATYRALHAGDGARKEAAAQMVLALPTECCVPLRIEMLTALGRRSEALALLDQFEAGMTPGRRPGNVGLFLWDPALRSLWNEPGMEEFLRRHGWSAYWDTTRSQPDLCDQPRAPLFCQLLSIERF